LLTITPVALIIVLLVIILTIINLILICNINSRIMISNIAIVISWVLNELPIYSLWRVVLIELRSYKVITEFPNLLSIMNSLLMLKKCFIIVTYSYIRSVEWFIPFRWRLSKVIGSKHMVINCCFDRLIRYCLILI